MPSINRVNRSKTRALAAAFPFPSEYLILRQPTRFCEVVFVKDGAETVLFSGKRWPARHAFRAFLNSIPYENTRAFVRKETGSVVEVEDSERETV